MRTVYLVTKGSYSDYRVMTAFSTREKADAFVAALKTVDTSAYDEPRVEEYWLDIDGTQADEGYSLYEVRIKRNGDVMKVHKHDEDISVWFSGNLVSQYKSEYADMQMFARDETHAIKIANERRAMMIATEQWEVSA